MEAGTWLALVVLLLFVLAAAAMVTRVVPALLALPVLAAAIAVTAAAFDTDLGAAQALGVVMQQGSTLLAEAMIVSLLGGSLSFLLHKSGVAERIVKSGAELFGEDPLVVSVLAIALIALLFTTIGGLGAIVLVAMIVLPLLATLGIEGAVAGGILLFGISLGGLLNPGNWVVHETVLKVPRETVEQFALTAFALTFVAALLFIVVELARARLIRLASRSTLLVVGGAALVLAGLAWASPRMGDWRAWAIPSLWLVLGASVLLMVGDLVRRAPRWKLDSAAIRPWAFAAPLVPLLLVLVARLPAPAAFVVGIAYASLSTARPGSLRLLIQSMISGAQASMAAVVLMIGIGMLVVAVKGPSGSAAWPIQTALLPLVEAVTPTSPLAYVLLFGLAAPLALWRGPLNTWGLGYGVAGVLATSGQLPAAAITAMLISVGQVQGICDPTNTQNAWLAAELKVDVHTLLARTLPYAWALAFAGLIAGAIYYMA